MKKQDFVGRLREVSILICDQCELAGKFGVTVPCDDCWKHKLVNIIRDLVNNQ